jgi:2-phospho-L-lactate guanylyltransferase
VRAAVVVPLKRFDTAKARLAPALEPTERARLARALALGVLAAAAPLYTLVVCEDDEVADFARDHGAEPLLTPGLGLSGAVEAGVAELARRGYDHAVVAHGDLPFVASLSALEVLEGGVTVAPDRRVAGSNVVAVPTTAGFRFCYGPRSYERHREEARRLGLSFRTVHDWRFALDLDLPADLDAARRALSGGVTAAGTTSSARAATAAALVRRAGAAVAG